LAFDRALLDLVPPAAAIAEALALAAELAAEAVATTQKVVLKWCSGGGSTT
jgi:hypothetical protein